MIQNPENGHFYKLSYIHPEATQGFFGWYNIVERVPDPYYNMTTDTYLHYGLGYLATITSDSELEFINNNVIPANIDENAVYLIGASDEGDNGNWTWRTGPEKGEEVDLKYLAQTFLPQSFTDTEKTPQDVIGRSGEGKIGESHSSSDYIWVAPNTSFWNDKFGTGPFKWMKGTGSFTNSWVEPNSPEYYPKHYIMEYSNFDAIDLSSSRSKITEGSSMTFKAYRDPAFINNTNETLQYRISGVSEDDLDGTPLTGSINFGSDGFATKTVSIKNDSLTEGQETLVFTLLDQTVSVVIEDKAASQIVPNDNAENGDSTDTSTPTLPTESPIGNKSGEDSSEVMQNPENGHYYQHVLVGEPYSGTGARDGLTWDQALLEAETKTYNGLQGYLLTITSFAEQQFIKENVLPSYDYGHNYWISAGKEQTTTNWTWQAGPEKGQAVSYSNWDDWYNNYGRKEEYLDKGEFVAVRDDSDGEWLGWRILEDENYIPTAQAYIIEYGDTIPQILSGNNEVNSLEDLSDNIKFVMNAANETFTATENKSKLEFQARLQDLNVQKVGESWKISGSDIGTDTLIGFKRLEFSNGTLALDIDAGDTAGQAYRLYQAAFARTPDMPGVAYHMNDMESNDLSVTQIAGNFIASPEFKTQYGENPTEDEYINLLYQNVLGRTPQQFEVDYYKDRFEQGTTDWNTTLVFFAESPENIALVGPDIANGIWLPDV